MEQKIIFREMLSEVKELADAHGNKLTKDEVCEFFANAQLNEEQIGLICEYLLSQKITVEGYEAKNQNPFVNQTVNEPMQAAETTMTVEASRTEEASEAAKAATEKSGTDTEAEEMIQSLELYLEELEELGRLDAEEELRLFQAVAARRDTAAKSRLVENYLPIVCELAGDYGGEAYTSEDLIQEGNIGLLLALDELEPMDSLAAYQAELLNKINQSMEEALKEQKDLRDLGNGIASRVNHLNEAIRNLEEDLEHRVSVEELSAYLEMPVEEIKDILRMAGDEIKVEGYENN